MKDFKVWKQFHIEKLVAKNRWDEGPLDLSQLTKERFLLLVNQLTEVAEEDLNIDFIFLIMKLVKF